MKRKSRANGEGTIIQRKDKDGKPTGVWQSQFTDDIGKRRTYYGKTQQEALKKMKEAQKKSEKGISLDANKITFADWMVEWLEVYSRPQIRMNTYSSYYFAIHNHIIPAFPKVLLKDVRSDMLQKFINSKSESGRLDKVTDHKTGKRVIKPGGLARGSLNSLKKVMYSALKQAVENDLIERNPAERVRMPKFAKKEVQILSVSDQKKLEAAAMEWNNPLAFTIVLALYTGMRIGEILGLTIDDINFEKKELYVRRTVNNVKVPTAGRSKAQKIINEPKTEKGRRSIPLPNFVLDMLREYIADRNAMVEAVCGYWKYNTTSEEAEAWEDEGYIFITSQGELCGYTNLTQIFKRVIKVSGVKPINFHALRHTFATRCLEAGFDIKSLSDILGHTDAKMTLNVYSHALDDHKRGNMDKLIRLWGLEEKLE